MDDGLDIPSFTRQTNFESGVFNFGLQEKKGLDFFNPGLVRRPDGLWLITRRSKWQQGLRFGMNDVVAFLLEGRNPVRMAQIQHHRRWPDEQFEDPRSIYHNGRTWVGCCDFIWTAHGWTGAHQIICEISNDWQQVQRYDPVYGNNGDNMGKNSGHEKNWVWFFYNDLPHLIYAAQPHTVCQFSNEFVFQKEFITKTSFPWNHGIVRGGTPPIKVGDEYWTFFHSSTIWRAPKRRYHMGAYAFESKPPFRITQMTHKPILSGSQQDRWAESKPLVIFPCGSEYQDGKWLVTMGINDLNAGWIEIPHTDIMERCAVKKSFSLGRWASELITGKTGVIAYIPPPGIGHTEVFLKNLKEHPPSSQVHLLSDHTWPGAKSIPAPNYESKDKIACYVFLHALELAERQELDKFVYLETDCRVYGIGWDKHLFRSFPNGTFDAIAGGNLAVTGYDRAERDFKALVEKIVKKHGYERCHSVADRTKVIFQGELNDKPVGFVNGAPAVYSTKAVREIVGGGTIESIVVKMSTSDHSIGAMCSESSTPTAALKRYVHIPEIMATAGETIYPFHVRRNALQSGDCVAVHPIKNRWRPPPEGGASFYHCGDLGDILYGLKAIKLYGGGKLVLGQKCYSKCPPRATITKEVFELWKPLLEHQKYLTGISFEEHFYDATHDLNEFRTLWNERDATGLKMGTLCEAHCVLIGVEPLFNCEPWLTSERKEIARIIVHRSFRYRDNFPWQRLVNHYRGEMCFVGLLDEYEDFCKSFGKIACYQPRNFADMAAVINGAQWMLANQSFPLSLAIALGKRVVIEEWAGSPDCTFKRPDFYTQRDVDMLMKGSGI